MSGPYDYLLDKYKKEQRLRKEIQEELRQLKQKAEKKKEPCANYGRCNCSDPYHCVP